MQRLPFEATVEQAFAHAVFLRNLLRAQLRKRNKDKKQISFLSLSLHTHARTVTLACQEHQSKMKLAGRCIDCQALYGDEHTAGCQLRSFLPPEDPKTPQIRYVGGMVPVKGKGHTCSDCHCEGQRGSIFWHYADAMLCQACNGLRVMSIRMFGRLPER